MPPDEIAGDLIQTEEGTLEGWCWSRTRPGQRLTVEVMVNDMLLGATVAGRFRQDLLDRAIGDGRHGFLLRPFRGLPKAPFVISARVRRPDGSGLPPFARVMRGATELPEADLRRLARCDAELQAVRADLSTRPGAPSAQSAALRRAFAGLAAELEALARGQSAADLAIRHALARLPSRIVRWDAPAAPAASVVLLAGDDPATTLAALSAYAPLSRQHNAEIMLVDSGLAAAQALIPARVPGLRYVRDTGVRNLCAAINLAIPLLRSGRAVILQADAPRPSAVALGRLLTATQSWPLIVPTTTVTMSLDGEWLPGLADTDGLGLVLAGQIGHLVALGGLDEALSGDLSALWTDLSLKAAMIAIPTARPSQRDPRPASAHASMHTAGLLAARWGAPCG